MVHGLLDEHRLPNIQVNVRVGEECCDGFRRFGNEQGANCEIFKAFVIRDTFRLLVFARFGTVPLLLNTR